MTQNIIVAAFVLIAAAFLAVKLTQTLRAKSCCGCGKKSGCAKMMDSMDQADRVRQRHR